MDVRNIILLIIVAMLGYQPVRAATPGTEAPEPPAETGQSAPSPAPGTEIEQLPPGPIGARPAEEIPADEADGPRISPRAIAIGVGVAALLAAIGGGGGGGGGSATQH